MNTSLQDSVTDVRTPVLSWKKKNNKNNESHQIKKMRRQGLLNMRRMWTANSLSNVLLLYISGGSEFLLESRQLRNVDLWKFKSCQNHTREVWCDAPWRKMLLGLLHGVRWWCEDDQIEWCSDDVQPQTVLILTLFIIFLTSAVRGSSSWLFCGWESICPNLSPSLNFSGADCFRYCVMSSVTTIQDEKFWAIIRERISKVWNG